MGRTSYEVSKRTGESIQLDDPNSSAFRNGQKVDSTSTSTTDNLPDAGDVTTVAAKAVGFKELVSELVLHYIKQ